MCLPVASLVAVVAFVGGTSASAPFVFAAVLARVLLCGLHLDAQPAKLLRIVQPLHRIPGVVVVVVFLKLNSKMSIWYLLQKHIDF